MSKFYFAWVDETDTAFSETLFTRQDEDIVTLSVTHREGEFAHLQIEIRNPRIGLLNPTRKQWAWVSYDNGSSVVPIFFGRLVGVPPIKGELITIEFLAKPSDYVAQKAELAQTLKTAPFYDPVFIQPTKRADPDTVLETRTALWHIDRLTGVVTISDIINGEDGLEVFNVGEVPYESMIPAMGQQPLISVTVNAHVGWTQADHSDPGVGVGSRYSIQGGFFTDGGVRTFTGASIVSSWPKVDASFGHGWSCAASAISSTFDTEVAGLSSGNVQGKPSDVSDEDPFGQFADFPSDFGDDDPTQVVASSTWSNLEAPKDWVQIMTELKTKGGVDGASVEEKGFYVPAETLFGYIKFGYDASRQRREHLSFTLQADVQALVSPVDTGLHVNSRGKLSSTSRNLDTQVIDVSGVDVGVPIDFELVVTVGGSITAGDVAELEIAISSGVEFTFDHTVLISDTLTSVAVALQTLVNSDPDLQSVGVFADTPVGSSFVMHFPTGTLSAMSGAGSTGAILVSAIDAALRFSVQGSIVAGDTLEVVVQPFGSFAVLIVHTISATDTTSSATQSLVNMINGGNTGAGDTITVGGASVSSYAFGQLGISASGPDDNTTFEYGVGVIVSSLFVVSYRVGTAYVSASASGSIEILSVQGLIGAPGSFSSVVVPIEYVGRRSYFPTTNGIRSLEYLIMLARAHLVLRARAVSISFQCTFERAINLSCRKNALVHDPRLPGGQAVGKITEYSFSADGDRGELIGTVKIGCCVGHGTSVASAPGTPEYAEDGYVDTGYQFYDGQTVTVGPGDVGYSVPLDAPVDDGIVFPLTEPLFLDSPKFHSEPVPHIKATMSEEAVKAAFARSFDSFQFVLMPLDTGPFETLYSITVTDLSLPRGIDLESAT